MIDPPEAYGPCMSRTTTVPASSSAHATPHQPARVASGAVPPGHRAKTTTAPPSASASPKNATPRAKASIVRTVASTRRPASNSTWLGAPMLKVNAPDTGCESVETTRQATT